MSKLSHSLALGGIGGGGTLLALFTWLFEPAEVSSWIAANPKFMMGLVCLLLIIVFVLIQLLCNRSKEFETGKAPTLYEEGKNWVHTVLVIDDKAAILGAIKDELQGFDVVCIERIDDYRLAAEFEIIVSDIFDCSPGTTAASVINKIKEKYPYKVVIPMSAQPAACDNLKADYETIFKDEGYKFVSKIEKKISAVGKELDRANDYWIRVEQYLRQEHIPTQEIQRIRTNYYRFVNKKQNGL